MSYGERHFDATNQGIWASVLLLCGQFERVSRLRHHGVSYRLILLYKAVAALWERPETEIEAVHLAIALAYHGLLRVPSRAETSELGPRMSSHILNIRQLFKNHADSVLVASQPTCLEPFHTDLALCPPVCENGRERSAPIRLLRLLIRRSG